MNLIDAKIQNYSKAQVIYMFLPIWRRLIKQNIWVKKTNKKNTIILKMEKGSCTLTTDVNSQPGAGDWEDLLPNVETKENFLNWNNLMMMGYNSGSTAAALCSHLVVLLGRRKK